MGIGHSRRDAIDGEGGFLYILTGQIDRNTSMRKVAATELKANLAALLGDVERGEVIEITRHGKTIARIRQEDSAEREANRDEVRRAIDDLRKLRDSLPKVGITIEEILDMRHAGHRY
jgi:antitoxin (DNA-binding transcriptional repressor) of toxin-antitoxin stability system